MVRLIRTRVLTALVALGVVASLAACGTANSAAENHPPELSLNVVGSEVQYIIGEEIVDIVVTAQDPDGDALSFRVANKPEEATLQTSAQEARFQWTPNADDVTDGDPVRLTFIVEDEHGARADRVLHVSLKPGNGRPQFVSSSTYSHDVASKNPVDFQVRVDDDDSERVELTMPAESAPKGASFEQTGPTSGRFTWKPSAKQKSSTSESVTFRANDGDFAPVTQQVTVLFRDSNQQTDPDDPRTNQNCDRERAIEHTPLGPQRTAENYPIEATFSETAAEKYDFSAVLWSTETYPDNNPDQEIESAELTIQGRDISGSIPNLGLSSGEVESVYYLVCALDREAPEGAEDKVVCSSDVTYHAFKAYPPNAEGCADDDTDFATPSNAASVSTERWKLYRSCKGNPDFHKFEVGPGESVTTFFTYPKGQEIEIEAFDDSMTRLDDALTVSGCAGIASVEISHGTADGTATYYAKVTGGDIPYQSTATVEGGSGTCEADGREPNDTTGNATSVSGNPEYGSVSICPKGDLDLYAVDLLKGDVFGARLSFDHGVGNIDTTLFAPSQSGDVGPQGGGVAESRSKTDGEEIVRTVGETGTYHLSVYANGETNDYSVDFDVTCRDGDQFSGNHSRDAAALPSEGSYSGLKQCGGQSDWYEFTVFSGQTLSATVEPKAGASASDIAVDIYNEAGDRIQEGVVVDDKLLVDKTISEKAQYFIEVASPRSFRYSVSFERRNN